MLRIEIDHVLRYVATGEDESLVLDVLRAQPDAAAVLGQARAALELLGPAGLGKAAAERLAKVVRVVEGPEPPPASSPPERSARFASRSLDIAALRASLAAPSASLGKVSGLWLEEPRLPPGLAAALRKGAAEAVRLGTAVLHKPFVKRDRGGPDLERSARVQEGEPDLASDSFLLDTFEPRADYLRGDASYSLASDDLLPADAEPPPEDTPILRSGARFEAPGGATIELSCQTDAGGDRLRVVLKGGRAATQPLLVTCIPATGPMARATTDAAGTAVLPWPAPGAGVLRVDADRTVEIALKVEL
jgi:hypothetical protein